jgi:ATP-binding protein involved in chromosome partitioning
MNGPELGISNVKFSIAVASGKGGVGKSTVSTNLAVAVAKLGFKVGLLDADIYGPSQPGMLGSLDAKPDTSRGYLRPVEKFGVKFISIGLLMEKNSPVIWRAPIAMKMIHQFLEQVEWGELDYLFIDLPPGTGDVQLTLAQQAQLSGAVIVTTPQEVALGVARKGLKMFQQVNVPIIGIIENMSGFICGHCGKDTAIFAKGGGEKLANEMKVSFLGKLPLDPAIMASGERGVPLLAETNESPSAKAFMNLAGVVTKKVAENEATISADEPESIQVGRDGNIDVQWPDAHRGRHTPHVLRLNCECAQCKDEDSGRKLVDPKRVPLDIKITGVNPVGRYGLSIAFSDGHNTGIYAFNKLRKICECEKCIESKAGQKSFSI